MSNGGLRTRLLASIGLNQASTELQEGFLRAFERIAQRRLGRIVYNLLSDEQVQQVWFMRNAGVPNSEVLAWIRSQLRVPYDDLYEAVLLAVLQEVEMAHARR